MRYAMIMAGGSGTRLWPLSRRDRPKQLVPFIGGRSLLEIAVERAHAVADPSRTAICAAASYMDEIRRISPRTPDDLLLGEPTGRDTLSAIGLTAAVLAARDPDAVFCVLTADHLIEPLDRFAECVETGFALVERDPDRLVTFSIRPTFAATGFGYVERATPIDIGAGPAAHTVARFVEKPDRPTAEQYVASGRFGWNSGMFVWRASAFLAAVERFRPDAHAGLVEIARAWGAPTQTATLARVYPELPKISVDFAVMEPASASGSGFEVCTVEMDLDWRDVGSWPSFAETLDSGASGVRASVPADGAVTLDCRDTLIVSDDPGHTVAALGVSGLVIVHTRDATLVMPAADAERLKELHTKLPERLR